ncbi:hypothetical protein ABWL39_10730 [Chitinivorax sp. PXF-14]|uniref:hypothetical protein n=1 Tax=Chitinivorax sp. PXF-14 TaxID=3230488 RepID=UPI0034679D0D
MNTPASQSFQRSMLGQVLIKKGLVTEDQLNRAIAQQQRSGQKLGEILTEWNLVTKRQIQGALRRQRNLRVAATLATALLGPLQAFAVSPVPASQISAQTSSRESGLKALSEEEMGDISAQGFAEDRLRQLTGKAGSGDGVETMKELAQLMNPLLQFIDAETSMKDVTYDVDGARAAINADGSVTLKLPSSIGELSFNNIRVKGSEGASMGSLTMKGIDLRGSSMTILPNKR